MKLPPYGKSLKELIDSGKKPSSSIKLYIGSHAWQAANKSRLTHPLSTLVLPPWLCPKDYDWPVSDCGVMIYDTGYALRDYLNDLAICLYQAKALSVSVVNTDSTIIIYQKDLVL